LPLSIVAKFHEDPTSLGNLFREQTHMVARKYSLYAPFETGKNMVYTKSNFNMRDKMLALVQGTSS